MRSPPHPLAAPDRPHDRPPQLLTTTVLYSPPGLTGAAADAARALDAAFTGAAKELLRFSNLRFAEVASPAAMDAFEVPTDAARVVVYKEHDEGRAEYAGALDAAALREFVLRHDVPLVTTVWHRNLQPFRRRVGSLALFFATERQVEHPPTLARLRAKLNDVTYALEAKVGAARVGVGRGGRGRNVRAVLWPLPTRHEAPHPTPPSRR